MNQAAVSVKPILIFTCGNPSRGDDALGTEFISRLQAELKQSEREQQVELLTDFQFQVEHATDLFGRELVIFADACVSSEAPFQLIEIEAANDLSYTTHSMSPVAVLEVYQQLYNEPPPESRLLSIRGYEFELGASLSTNAEQNLQQAVSEVKELCLNYPL